MPVRIAAAMLLALLQLVPAASVAAEVGRAVGVTVAPATAAVAPLGQRQFRATVSGTAATAVTWMVNGIPGGTPTLGLISRSGLYVAPADVAATLHVAVEAEVQAQKLVNAAASVTVAPAAHRGATFHVATTGKDSAAGSLAHPWRTIQHAVTTVPAGSTILVHTGIYNELVTITRSGSAAAGFLTVAAAPGETPVIDGTRLPIPGGENGLISLIDASFIRISGLELRNYRSTSAASVPAGIYVIGGGRHIEILRNHIHDIVTTVTSSAGDALGIAIYGSSLATPLSSVIIDGNELDALVTGFSESLALSGNVVGFAVTGNLIHDNDNIGIDVAGYEGLVDDPALDRARQGYVAGNTVYNITSTHNPAYGFEPGADGIYVDGGSDIVVERNLSHDNDIGIEAASEHQSDGVIRTSNDVTIRSNVIYRSGLVGISIGGADAAQNGGSTNCIVVNNTLVDDDKTQSGSGEVQIQFHADGNSFANDVVVANAQGLMLSSIALSPARPATLDHDLYDSPLGAGGSIWNWLGHTYTGLARFRSVSGQDRSSVFADPRFMSAARHDYRLSPGSPAIGIGKRLPLSTVGLFDFAGRPRSTGTAVDVGAYEHP